MNELRINKDRVSHIEIYDTIKGIQKSGHVINNSYELLPRKEERIKYFIPFFNETLIYPEAYYKNGVYELSDYWTYSYTKEEINDIRGLYISGIDVWTKVFVKIYAGSHMIKSLYFDNIEEAKKYCEDNFPNVNIII